MFDVKGRKTSESYEDSKRVHTIKKEIQCQLFSRGCATLACMTSLHLLQARYWDSSHSLTSARTIIAQKCFNMRHLLLRALPYRKAYPPQAGLLKKSIQTITRIESLLPAATDRRALLLFEASATRAYWKSIALSIHCPPHWKRMYPHARDPWNQSLNIGYTILAKRIKEILTTHHLSTEIGMLHVPKRNHDALIYDIEELFRVPVVDMQIIHAYARRKNPPPLSRIAFMVTTRLKERWYFQNAWHSLETFIDFQISNYISALTRNTVYLPFVLPWGHRTKKSRSSP